ncbi:alpha/beta hydrolase [Spongisporangium articulatum]|uniref:Alpha/beta hydrolase n=1 Tax=Spongisporangium articulatum TaxID=3362603 RepID=A0ABW8AW45_9ACTN
MSEPSPFGGPFVLPDAPSQPKPPVVVENVTGGAASVRVEYAELERLALFSEDTAATFLAAVARGHAVLVDPNLLASAVLNPGGAARVEAVLLEALDGPHGLTLLAGELTAHAATIRLTSLKYQATDALEAESMRLLDGMLAATGLGTAAFLLVNPLALLATGGAAYLGKDQLVDGMQWLVTEHPGVVDHLLRGLPSLISNTTGIQVSQLEAQRLLAAQYPDSPGYLADRSQDPAVPGTPPGNVADLIRGLDYVNETKKQDMGQIAVQVLRGPDGQIKSVIVDVPGTDDFNPKPWVTNDSGTINDMPTNFHAMNGDTTSYEKMVEEALRRSGVPGGKDGPPVMLVGHSQGGIVATAMAGHTPYNVTHVVTAGSPVAAISVPSDVQVLSLENNSDVVPHLDAVDNPDTANRTTVTFDVLGQEHRAGTAHSMKESYIPGAEAVDASPSASVKTFKDGASPFLENPSGTTVTTNRYQASRDPGAAAGSVPR